MNLWAIQSNETASVSPNIIHKEINPIPNASAEMGMSKLLEIDEAPRQCFMSSKLNSTQFVHSFILRSKEQEVRRDTSGWISYIIYPRQNFASCMKIMYISVPPSFHCVILWRFGNTHLAHTYTCRFVHTCIPIHIHIHIHTNAHSSEAPNVCQTRLYTTRIKVLQVKLTTDACGTGSRTVGVSYVHTHKHIFDRYMY